MHQDTVIELNGLLRLQINQIKQFEEYKAK